MCIFVIPKKKNNYFLNKKRVYMSNCIEVNIQLLAENYINEPNENNFKVLYNRLRPSIYNYIYNMDRNNCSDVVNDICSSVFLKIYNNINSYKSFLGSFSTWAYRIAYNEFCNDYKDKYRKTKLEINTATTELTDDEVFNNLCLNSAVNKDEFVTYCDIDSREEEDFTRKVITLIIYEIYNTLDDYSKKILLDREVNQTSYKDLCIKYNTTMSVVKNKIHFGREKIVISFLEKTDFKSVDVLDELSRFIIIDRFKYGYSVSFIASKYNKDVSIINEHIKNSITFIKSNMLNILKKNYGVW